MKVGSKNIGKEPGDVQKLMRHKSLRTTMDILRHMLPGQLERNFEVFNDLYREYYYIKQLKIKGSLFLSPKRISDNKLQNFCIF